jgi:hexosaminidase
MDNTIEEFPHAARRPQCERFSEAHALFDTREVMLGSMSSPRAPRSFCKLLIVCMTCEVLRAQHPVLLPAPQHLEYGSKRIPLTGLAILISPDAAAEERFAAEQLVRAFFARSGISLRTVQQQRDEARVLIRLERTGSSDALPIPGEKAGPGSREGYHLEISDNGIVISSLSSAGIFYGVQTLRQLIQSEAGTYYLPEVRIDDWPDIAYRGTMIDMSEGPLATIEEVLRQLDFLTCWKANQFYFYNEDSIELKGFPLLNAQARFSDSEVRRIVAYGRERHIDVIPCLELYGHQHDLFRLEKYSDLADFPHGGEFDPGNARAQAVLNDWISQFIQLFPSRFVHIGFDETWEISQAAKREDSKSTPAKLFVRQLNNVASQFRAAGRTVLAWGDIIVRYPEIVSQLPTGMIVVPWWYEPDPDPAYKRWLQALTVPGIERFVAPGVHGWSEVTPDFEKTFRNIDTFLAAGSRAKSIGMINTVWTDDQQCLHRTFWPGMAYGSAAAWKSVPISADTFFKDYAHLMYTENAAENLGIAFTQLARAQSLLETAVGHDTMDRLWQSPFTVAAQKVLRAHSNELHQARLLAEDAQATFQQSTTNEVDRTTLDSFLFGSRLLDYVAMRGQYAIEIDDLWRRIALRQGHDEQLWERLISTISPGHGRVGDILDSLSLLLPEYRKNWEAEYQPYRMQTALARWETEYQFWLRVQSRIQRFHAAYRGGSPLPSLYALTGEY